MGFKYWTVMSHYKIVSDAVSNHSKVLWNLSVNHVSGWGNICSWGIGARFGIWDGGFYGARNHENFGSCEYWLLGVFILTWSFLLLVIHWLHVFLVWPTPFSSAALYPSVSLHLQLLSKKNLMPSVSVLGPGMCLPYKFVLWHLKSQSHMTGMLKNLGHLGAQISLHVQREVPLRSQCRHSWVPVSFLKKGHEEVVAVWQVADPRTTAGCSSLHLECLPDDYHRSGQKDWKAKLVANKLVLENSTMGVSMGTYTFHSVRGRAMLNMKKLFWKKCPLNYGDHNSQDLITLLHSSFTENNCIWTLRILLLF